MIGGIENWEGEEDLGSGLRDDVLLLWWCLGLSEDPVSIWTTCLKEVASAWTKVVGYGFPDSDLGVRFRVGVMGGLLLSVLLLLHRGDGFGFVEASLYLGEFSIVMREREKERLCVLFANKLCFGSVRKYCIWSLSFGSLTRLHTR